ncbi:hypothetical protein, partial [Salmonella sp. s51228]|uniref:hypothetical protein n=1 Tax=Salmonella sp. s51228 TaxID=3159652 RepID=UPI00398137F6
MAPSYVRKSDAVVIVYDVTDSSSFIDVPTYWLPFVRKYLYPGRNDVSMLLLGNKIDKLGMRTITAEDGSSIARDEGMQFCEVSARNSISVSKVFHCLSQTLVSKENEELDKLSQLTTTLRRNQIELDTNNITP